MDQTKNMSKKSGSIAWRPIVLICAMCILAFLAAWLLRGSVSLLGVLTLTVLGGVFALIFRIVRSPLALVPGVVISVAFLQVIGGLHASLLGMVTMIAALVLAHQVRLNAPKTTVLITVSLILGGGALIIAAGYYAARGGSLAIDDLFEKYHTFFKNLRPLLAENVHEQIAGIDEKTWYWYTQAGITREDLTETYMKTMELVVDLVELIAPGIILLFVQLIAYIEIASFRIAARLLNVDAVLPSIQWPLVPTQVSCIVYIAVLAIYMLASLFMESESVFLTVIVNLWLTLLPTMLFCGVRVLILRLRHPMYRSRTGILVAAFIFGCFFIAPVALSLAVFMLSFLGAQNTAMFHASKSDKKKKD